MENVVREQVEREGLQVEVIEVEFRRLKLLEKNARYMDAQTFKRLVENIRRDGVLTTLPFVALAGYYTPEDPIETDETGEPVWEVISGNHRVRAALEAGLERGLVLATRDPLPRDRRIALQLAHNAIVGKDDRDLLRELYHSIQEVDWRIYSGHDDRQLDLTPIAQMPHFPAVSLEYQTLTFAFLPDEAEQVQKALEDLEKRARGLVMTARLRDYELFLETVTGAGQSQEVHNSALALLAVIGLAALHAGDLTNDLLEEATERREWVSLFGLFGTTRVPPAAAQVIRRAVERGLRTKDVSKRNLWQLIEYWAADYLAGATHDET